MTDKLPPLPLFIDFAEDTGEGLFSKQQMLDFYAKGRADALEDAAKMLTLQANWFRPMSYSGTPSFDPESAGACALLDSLAEKIRALKDSK
jgi:hypothetical protein